MKLKLIRTEPNPSGAYPPIQEVSSTNVPDGMALWPDSLETDTYYQYNGFVSLTIDEATEDTPVTVASYTANVESWEAWKASLPPEPEPEVSDTEVLNTLLGVNDNE